MRTSSITFFSFGGCWFSLVVWCADPNRPGVKMKQLEEMGKEDDLELVNKATVRDRQWDNWKDMNTKGYGVTNKI